MAWSDESLTPPSSWGIPGTASTTAGDSFNNHPDDQNTVQNPEGNSRRLVETPPISELIIDATVEQGVVIGAKRPVSGTIEPAEGGGGSARPETPGLLWPRGS